jgi:hypothetical protein
MQDPAQTGRKMILSPRIRFSTMAAALTITALTLVVAAAPVAEAEGVRHCVDLTRRSPACYELVWVNGVQVRMTFPQSGSPRRATPNADVHNFYVMAPQSGVAQATEPFAHDHTVGVSPGQNRGPSVFWHGYFVLCSAEGISTGACVAASSSVPGLGTVPLAKSVNGQMLTSVDAIETAANAGLLTLVDTGAEFLGTINPAR